MKLTQLKGITGSQHPGVSFPLLEGSEQKREMSASESASCGKPGSLPQELNCPVWGSALRLGQAAKKTRQCVIKGEIAPRGQGEGGGRRRAWHRSGPKWRPWQAGLGQMPEEPGPAGQPGALRRKNRRAKAGRPGPGWKCRVEGGPQGQRPGGRGFQPRWLGPQAAHGRGSEGGAWVGAGGREGPAAGLHFNPG